MPNAAANQDERVPGLASDRVEDLLVDCGDTEHTIPYHLYTGTTMYNRRTLLVVRFATRFVCLEGQNLHHLRDAIAHRRCARLAKSDRTETMSAEPGSLPIVTRLRVVRPQKGNEMLEEELAEVLAEQDPPRPRT